MEIKNLTYNIPSYYGGICPTKTVFKWLLRSPIGMSMSDTCYNLYNAVYAVAHSLHEILLQRVDTQSLNPGKELELDSWKVKCLILNVYHKNDIVKGNHEVKNYVKKNLYLWMGGRAPS